MKKIVAKVLNKCLTIRQYDTVLSKYTIWMEKHIKSKNYLDAYCLKGGTEDADKQYYVFRWKLPEYMVLSVGLKMLLACEWAERNHIIPIVDIEYEQVYVDGDLGVSNMWEMCFDQVCRIEDICKKKNVLIGPVIRGKEDWKYLRETCDIINNNKEDPYIHAISDVYGYKEYYKKLNALSQNIWTVKPLILKEVDALRKELFYGKRVLGLSLREKFNADKKSEKNGWKVYSKHPASLPIEEICELLREYMEKWGFTHIFAATIFEGSIEKLKEEFGDKVLYINRRRKRQDKEYLDKSEREWELLQSGKINEFAKNVSNEDENLERTVSYMKEVLLLSKCDYFIGAKSSGTIAACIMNGGKFEDMYIIPDCRGSKKY